MTVSRVLLLRHGRTEHNADGRWQGQLDTHLDDVGLAQAERVAEVLAAPVERRLAAGECVRLVSSDLSRARRTAALLERRTGLTAIEDARLREIHGGAWQNLTPAEVAAAGMAEELERWRGGEDVPVGGGERRSEAARRGAKAVAEHAAAQDGGLLVVVAHGGVLRGVTLCLLGLPPGEWELLGGLGNCHWVVLDPRVQTADRWRLVTYNAGPDGAAGL